MTLELRGLPTFIVPGLHGSGERHWQTVWQSIHPAMKRIEQERWHVPALTAWSQRVAETLANADAPAILVAHSFGCLASIHAALYRDVSIGGVLLVAPAEPAKFGHEAELAHGPLPFPSLLVASSNDPWLEPERARHWARCWGSEFVDAGALGHINAETNLGRWDTGLALLQRLVDQLPVD